MKKRIAINVLKALLFSGLLVLLFFQISYLYRGGLAHTRRNLSGFYACRKNSLDVVFLGSSHSYCTFDPEIFDAQLGTSSFQMGMPLQHMDTTYYTFLEVLNYQHPKCVVLEVYWDMLDDDFELTQAGYLFQVMKNEQYSSISHWPHHQRASLSCLQHISNPLQFE